MVVLLCYYSSKVGVNFEQQTCVFSHQFIFSGGQVRWATGLLCWPTWAGSIDLALNAQVSLFQGWFEGLGLPLLGTVLLPRNSPALKGKSTSPENVWKCREEALKASYVPANQGYGTVLPLSTTWCPKAPKATLSLRCRTPAAYAFQQLTVLTWLI